MRLPDEPENVAAINIVPMIDVIFAILTFFIMSTLFLTRSQGLPVNLPKASTTQTQRASPITVTLDREGRMAVNRQPADLATLDSRLTALIKPNQEAVVILNADEQVYHGQVIAVMDRVRRIPGAKLAIAAQRQ